MNLREFARLMGVSHPVISRAAKAGRLTKSVTRDAAGRVIDIDPVAGATEWRENATRLPARPKRPAAVTVASGPAGTEEPVSLMEARARREVALAGLAEIQLAREQQTVVLAADVEKRLTDVFSRCKNRLLAVPAKLKQLRPHLAIADIRLLDDLMREAMEELAGTPRTQGASDGEG